MFQGPNLLKSFNQSKSLNAFLTNSKSILTENILNQWKIIKKITTCLLQPQYCLDKHQDF